MSQHNGRFGNDGREHMPPFPSASYSQPTFLTLQEVESRQFARGTASQQRAFTNSYNSNRNPMPVIDVSHSNLQPTAQEFRPGMSVIVPSVTTVDNGNTSLQNTGAVRRNNHYSKNPKTPQQEQPKHANKNNDNPNFREPKERKHVKTLENNTPEASDDQLTRKKSTGHNRDRRKADKQGSPFEYQGQNRYYHNQNHGIGNGNRDFNNGQNNYTGNKFRGHRNNFTRDRENSYTKDNKMSDIGKDSSEGAKNEKDVKEVSVEKENPREKERYSRDRENLNATDRDHSERDKFRDRKNYRDRDNYRDIRQRDNRDYRENRMRDSYRENRDFDNREKRDFDNREKREGFRENRDRETRDYRENRDRDSNRENRDNYRENRDNFRESNDRDNRTYREIRDRDSNRENLDNYREKRDSFRENKDRDNRDNYRESYGKEHWKGSRNYDRGLQKNWRERPSNYTKTKKPDEKMIDDVESITEPTKPNSTSSSNHKESSYKKKLDAASQRERLEHMVTHRMIECLVCCEKVRHTDRVWSCKQCFHILHLSCVQKWAKSSKLETGWRCPACQNVLDAVPSEYRCYCDKYSDPKFEPGLLAHSCGEVCRRSGRNCEHTCTLLCHPGPCPDCSTMVQRACGCGATKVTVKCNSNLPLTCDDICKKMLNCGAHTCGEKCHWSSCNDCKESVKQECFCGKQGRKVACVEDTHNVNHYECGDVCGKPLVCGNHKCTKLCHSGACSACPTDPKRIRFCPCGKMSLTVERTSCLDPIPCCDNECGKVLSCGQPNKPHKCDSICHIGECPPCPATTMVRCRCGHMYKEIACRELTTKADDARCQKKCTKMRMCSKHKCNQYCCIEVEHRCPLLCNRTLSCGLHKCESNCHSGRCEPCWQTSFEELYCECGASVIYPPVPCGTRAPTCNRPCSRVRSCGHEPHHNCHTGPCPACTLFTTKLCHGGHESRGTIPCHQEDFSCGMPCDMDMPCGQHRCTQVCHKGPCPTPCTQPCTVPKPNCEHTCNRPCHVPPCPIKPCKQPVVTSCPCGLRTGTNVCMNMTAEYQKMAMGQLVSKMSDINQGQAVDITDIVNKQKKGGPHKILECNEECKLVERNRRMAIGLQLRNPDLSAKLTPRYTDYLRQWAKKDPRFCQSVHDKLTELVQLAKQSKQKSRSHSFECMNREKRHFVHELCEHFGIESAAYDAEPNRNVVATASKEKSWLPSCSLIELIQRENGQRKVPGPVLKPPMRSLNMPSLSSSYQNESESVSLRLQSARSSNPADRSRPVTPPSEYIDYFDNPPDAK